MKPEEQNETIFFPITCPEAIDTMLAHSWVTLEGERFCLGKLDSCPFCRRCGWCLKADGKPMSVHQIVGNEEPMHSECFADWYDGDKSLRHSAHRLAEILLDHDPWITE